MIDTSQLITSSYEHKLGAAYHRIDNRGLLINTRKLARTAAFVDDELNKICIFLTNLWNMPVYVGNPRMKYKGPANSLNLNSPTKVLPALQNLGYAVPKVRKKDAETHEYSFEESVNELALRMLFGNPTLWPRPEAGEGIKKLLEAAELKTFRSKYINARLYKGQYFCNYNVAATLSGRRGSKKSIFGFGGNSQNFPSRGTFAEPWKECIMARPGKIFFMVDQMQAEDWPVQALAQNLEALSDMRRGVNRHYKFASAIFNRSIDDLKIARKSNIATISAQADMEYSLGKRGRHANNYGMQPNRMSEILAGEGYSVSPIMCKMILDTINRIDPNVKQIFHKYVSDCIFNDHKLRSPFGRERQFFGLRQNDKNYAVLNEAYSWIPQSTIGDNTGLAVLSLDGCNDYVVQESHDSICQEIPDNEQSLRQVFKDTVGSFKRLIRFYNGIEVEIPIEGKLALDWHNYVTINFSVDDFTEENVMMAYAKLNELRLKLQEEEEQEEEKNAASIAGELDR